MPQKKSSGESYVPIKYLNQNCQPPISFETSDAGALFYTGFGFLVIAGILAAIYWWQLRPRYDFFVPKKPADAIVLPSAQPETETGKETTSLPKLSTEDELAVIQQELDETNLPDFNDDLDKIKMINERL